MQLASDSLRPRVVSKLDAKSVVILMSAQSINKIIEHDQSNEQFQSHLEHKALPLTVDTIPLTQAKFVEPS